MDRILKESFGDKDEAGLNDVLITMTNSEMKYARQYHDYYFSEQLTNLIKKAGFSKYYEKALLKIVDAKRATGTMAESGSRKAADSLEQRKGDVEYYLQFTTDFSLNNIKIVAEFYEEKYGRKLTDTIKKTFSGDIANLFVDIVNYAISPAEYWARRFYEAVTAKDEIDKPQVNRAMLLEGVTDHKKTIEAYKRIYGRDMINDVERNTMLYYRKVLKNLLVSGHS